MGAITNKEVIVNNIKIAIKEIKKIQRRPDIGINKRLRNGKGIRLFTSKSSVCMTNEKGAKSCQCHENGCPFFAGEFGCRNMLTFIKNKDRNHIGHLEMYLMFWKSLNDQFKKLDKVFFLKNDNSRRQLRYVVKHVDKTVHALLKSKIV